MYQTKVNQAIASLVQSTMTQFKSAFMLGNQNLQSRSDLLIFMKWNVKFFPFWSKWHKKEVGAFVWSSIIIIYQDIYGPNHPHVTRRYLGFVTCERTTRFRPRCISSRLHRKRIRPSKHIWKRNSKLYPQLQLSRVFLILLWIRYSSQRPFFTDFRAVFWWT